MSRVESCLIRKLVATARVVAIAGYLAMMGAACGADDIDRARPACDGGLLGGVPLDGYWEGWCGRHGMGSKFESHESYGTMANNTTAATKMDLGTEGWFECEVYYDSEIHPGDGGGQHLIGVFSQSAKRAGPFDPDLDFDELSGWLRLDFAVREDELLGVIYQDSGDLATRTFRTGDYPFKAWRSWAKLRVEWRQSDDRIELTVNGDRSEHPIAGGLNPIGNILLVGNMDTNRGERCEGENDPCGLVGKVRFRNFSWGRESLPVPERVGITP
jgi:hypothetical protein